MKEEPLVLRRPAQLRAISSVPAHRVISVMERLRRASVAELAEHVGLPAGSLYYHVRKLERAGVLAPVETRRTGGRREVVYELPGSEVVLDPEGRGPAFLRELGRSVRCRLRWLERAYLAALGRPGTVRRRRGRNLSLHQHDVRLSRAKRAELQRRIEELEAFLLESDDPGEEDFTHVTVAVVPLPGALDGAG